MSADPRPAVPRYLTADIVRLAERPFGAGPDLRNSDWMPAAEVEREIAALRAEHWTCFHCGETFTTVGSARDHFGAAEGAEPGCLIRVKLGDERGLQMELRKAEAEIVRLRAVDETRDHEASCYHAMTGELERLFKGARSVQQAWFEWESMEGRALAAEARADAAEAERDTLKAQLAKLTT